MTHFSTRISDERGGSSFNLLVVLALLGLAVYSGFQYIPVAYQAYAFKDLMQQEVNIAAGTGKTPEVVKKQLAKQGADYGIPTDAKIIAEQRDGNLQATVKFTRPISLPGYVYQYEFDHTVKSSSMFSK